MKKKIKLRDLTVEQYKEWYSNNQCEDKNCNECLLNPVLCHTNDKDCWVYCKDLFSNKFLDQEVEIEVPDILTKEEKKYLSNVIKPFRDRVVSINKRIVNFENIENKIFHYIRIKIKSKTRIFDNEYINFPYFNNEMYKGMEANRQYTLEDLGL